MRSVHNSYDDLQNRTVLQNTVARSYLDMAFQLQSSLVVASKVKRHAMRMYEGIFKSFRTESITK